MFLVHNKILTCKYKSAVLCTQRGFFIRELFCFVKEFISVCEECFDRRAYSEEEAVHRKRTAFYSICILNSIGDGCFFVREADVVCSGAKR